MSAPAHRLAFTTMLTPEDCRSRLVSRSVGWGEEFKSRFTSEIDVARPLVGSVTVRGFRMRLRIPNRNPYQTEASGQFRAEPGGTRVDVRFGLGLAIQLFGIVWFGANAFGAVLVLLHLNDYLRREGALVLFPFGMIAAGIAMAWLGRSWARDEERELSEILVRELDAREREPAGRPIE